MSILNTRILLRSDTHENWLNVEVEGKGGNAVLLQGEIGIELLNDGSSKIKIGDGTKAWKDLPYFGGEFNTDELENQISSAIASISSQDTRIASLETNSATKDEVAAAKQEAIDAAVLRVLDENVNADFDTLKEVAQWISSHTSEATELINRLTAVENDYLKNSDKTELQGNIDTVNQSVTNVNTAIANLNAFVGELPEDATSENVIAYIKEAIDGIKIGDYAKVSALTELSNDLSSLEETVNGIQTKVSTNETEIKSVKEALNNKVDKAEGSRLINSEEIAKLEKLSIDTESGQVGISGTVAAGNVTGLTQKIADILNSSEASGIGNEGALLNSAIKTRHLDPAITALISGAVQASNLNTAEFTVAEGAVTLNKVNVNKLEQTEGEWLILNGGDANNTWE